MTANYLVNIYWALLLLCFVLILYRIQKGPSAPDRIVAVDILGTAVVGFCVLATVVTGRDFYLNVAIAWALLSFIGTVALSKYLEGRHFDE